MKKIVITAFEPFGGDNLNSSLKVLYSLPEFFGNDEVFKVEVPTVFYDAIDYVLYHLRSVKPDIIVLLGQDANAAAIKVESKAKNIMDAKIPDNRGWQPQGQVIYPDKPNTYNSTVEDIEKITKKLSKEKIPVELSFDAGEFVCNHLYYGVLNYLSEKSINVPCIFIHIPKLSAYNIDDMTNIVKKIIQILQKK